MKKKKISLNRKKVTDLSKEEMTRLNGGVGFTGGCTDGASCIVRTWWNCTNQTCTNDCGTISCKTKALCTQ